MLHIIVAGNSIIVAKRYSRGLRWPRLACRRENQHTQKKKNFHLPEKVAVKYLYLRELNWKNFSAVTTWVSAGRRTMRRRRLKRGQGEVDGLKECHSPDMQVKVRKGKCEKWAVHEKGEDAMSAIGQMRDEDATEVVEAQTETVMKWREEE